MKKIFKIFVFVLITFFVYVFVAEYNSDIKIINFYNRQFDFRKNIYDTDLDIFKITNFYEVSRNKENEIYKSLKDVEIKTSGLSCKDLFENNGVKNSTWNTLKATIKFMQYLAVILGAVFTIIDFIKVVPSQDKDAMKKVTTKAITRLIIVLLMFFVPILLKVIMDLFGYVEPLCGLF